MSYLTTNEVAKLLRVRRSKVVEWITSGRLPALIIDGKRPSYRIAEKDAVDALKVNVEATPVKRRQLPPCPRSYF
jgi:excisionase family DNA binding protein